MSLSVGIVGLRKPKITQCVFCDRFTPDKGNSTQDFIDSYPDLVVPGQVLQSWPKFSLLADAAPIVQDHLLFITRRHYISMASLPLPLRKQVSKYIQSLLPKISRLHPGNEILFFEHGAGKLNGQTIQCGGCGRTDHAHLHIMPVPKRKQPVMTIFNKYILRNTQLAAKSLNPLPFNIGSVAKTHPYLFLWSNYARNALVFVKKSDILIPSQLLRKLVAMEFQDADRPHHWLWQDYLMFNQRRGEKFIRQTQKNWS